MGRFGSATGLAGGAALVACGLLVIALAPFGGAWSTPAGLAFAVIGFALAATTVVGLRRGPDSSQAFWTAILDAVLLIAALTAVLPVLAIIRGSVELFAHAHVHDTRDAIAYALAFTGLLLGGIFFAYAVKYYLSTGIVLLSALLPAGRRRNGNGHDAIGAERQHSSGLIGISRGRGNGNGNGNGNGDGNGYHIDLGYHPFVSVHVAAYNEKRVIERLLEALDKLDYPAYEVVVVDDSTDESIEILQRWRDRPRFKILHRNSRHGYKGGALREALKATDPRTEYIVIFDADSVPFPDSIERLLPHFYRVSEARAGRRMETVFGRSDPPSEPGQIKRRAEVAAVQSYQWHVLNKSESWLTEAVRAEYAGSYMVERPFQDAVGALKMVAGTAYMIRADILRQVGWGTSLTEDWELTLKLYARGYKVAYTPWAETPAECVATFSRLARQRMRWAEGHTHNVRKWFWPIMVSPYVSPIEKLEFAFDATYYLQAALFVLGSASWLISDVVFRTHVPGWTAVLGWSLLFSNIFALPLMNLGGLILEEAPGRDLQGVLGALVLSFALVPFQGWAALKGLIRKEEGPWFRTPKTGRITDEVHHLRRLRMLRQWLLGPRETRLRPAMPPPSPPVHWSSGSHRRHAGWIVAGAMALAIALLVWGSTKAPISQAAGNPLYLHGSGVAPCAASTIDQTAGTRTTACSIQSQSGGVITTWAWTALPAQTITAGVWTFTMYWTGGTGNTLDTVTISAGVVSGSSCALFVPSVPNAGTTWTTTYGGSGANTTSPFTVSTSGSQAALSIPAGGSLCVRVV